MIKKIIVFSGLEKIPEMVLDVIDGMKCEQEFFISRSSVDALAKRIDPRSKINKVNLGKSFLEKENIFDIFSVCRSRLIKLKFLLTLAFKKDKKDCALVFLGINEKLLLTKIANFFKFKIIWIESQDVNFQKLNKKKLKKYSKLLNFCELVVFSNFLKSKISALGVPEEKIIFINPGIKLGSAKYQDNIFSNIAKYDHSQIGKKFFSIGTVNDFSERETLEFVFRSFAKAQHIVTKSQLLVLNQKNPGQEAVKWSRWLAKKIEIDNMVWFINEADNLLKWMKSLDLLIICSNDYKSELIQLGLLAMHSGLAVIAPASIGFEDIIDQEKNGILYKLNDSDSLSEKIILVYKDRQIKINMQSKASATVEEKFRLEQAIGEFKRILG